MSNASRIKTAESYIKTLCIHDISIIESIFAENAIVEDPVGNEPVSGIEKIKEFYTRAFDVIQHAELLGSVRCTDHTAAFPFKVLLDSGDLIMELEAIDVFEFDEAGKVTSMKAYWGPENMKPA